MGKPSLKTAGASEPRRRGLTKPEILNLLWSAGEHIYETAEVKGYLKDGSRKFDPGTHKMLDAIMAAQDIIKNTGTIRL